MSYLAAVFLLYLDEWDSFVCLANLLSKPTAVEFYLMKAKSIQIYTKTFDYFFKQVM